MVVFYSFRMVFFNVSLWALNSLNSVSLLLPLVSVFGFQGSPVLLLIHL